MNTSHEIKGLQLRSLLNATGKLELSLAPITISAPGPEEVVVRIEAPPINPADILVMLAGADVSTMQRTGAGKEAVLKLNIPPAALSRATGTGRIGLSLGIGYEASGV